MRGPQKSGGKSGALMRQEHGGAIRRGSKPGNTPGSGRPPSCIRAHCRGSFTERVAILEQIADGEPLPMTVHYRGETIKVEVSASIKERVQAIDALGKYGGIEKLALTIDEKPEREVTPERVEDMWKRLRMITSIEELEHLMVAHAQKQIADGVA